MSFEEIFNNMESTIDSNNIQEEIIYLDNFLPASEVLNEEHVITGYEVTPEKLNMQKLQNIMEQKYHLLDQKKFHLKILPIMIG